MRPCRVQSALRKHSKKEKPEVEAAGDLMVQALLDVMEVAEFMHSPALEVSHAPTADLALNQPPMIASEFFGAESVKLLSPK